MRFVPPCLALAMALAATPALPHELWLEPTDWHIPAEGRVVADLVNGQSFTGIHLAYFPNRFISFTLHAGDGVAPVEGRMGDTPAMDAAPLGTGLHVAAYVSTSAVVRYESYEKFASFAAHKDLMPAGDLRAAHLARGLPDADFAESYSRFSKTLVAVGDSPADWAGSDRRLGLETELVALDNPYLADPAGGVRVQLYYGDAVRGDEQVELFDRAPDGTVAVTLHRTDADGIATLPVQPGHDYMADAVLLREPAAALAAEDGTVWETLWANLTFSVP